MTTQEYIKEALGFRDIEKNKNEVICQKAEQIFRGYVSEYHYVSCDHREATQCHATSHYDDEGVPLHAHVYAPRFSHCSSSNIKFFITHYPEFDAGDPIDPLSIIGAPFLEGNLIDDPVPLYPIHTDVLPGIIPRDEVLFQVTLVAEQISVHTPTNFDNPDAAIHSPQGNFIAVASLIDEKDITEKQRGQVVLTAPILRVGQLRHTHPESMEDHLILEVQTQYGPLWVVALQSKFADSELSEDMVGKIAHVSGWLTADPAIEEYQSGAIYDESHIFRLFFSSCVSQTLRRCIQAMRPDCSLEIDGKEQAKTREEVITALRPLCYFEEGVVTYCQIEATKPSALYPSDKNTIRCTETIERKGGALFFFDFEDNRIKRIRVDTHVENYTLSETQLWQQWLNPDYALPSWKREAEKKMPKVEEGDHPDNEPDAFLGEHDESLGDVLTALYVRDEEQWGKMLAGQLPEATPNSAKQIVRDDGECPFETYEIAEGKPGLTVFVDMETRDIKLMAPRLPGDSVEIEVEAAHRWKNGVGGEIAFSIPGFPDGLSAYVPYFYVDELQLKPGAKVRVNLAAVAEGIRKSERRTLKIREGAFYKMELGEFLKENPDKTEADFEPPSIVIDGGAFRMPTKYVSYFSYHLPVLEVEKIAFLDRFCYRLRVEFLRSAATDDVLSLNLYVGEESLDGYIPKAGDNIEGTLWLEATVPEANCRQ